MSTSTKEDEIIYQGPGWTIARRFKAGTLVPYGRAERPDGNVNYGWIDLRDRPDLVADIPEAQKSEGLAKLLRIINKPRSTIMSSACECAAFDNGENCEGPRWQVGGFVVVMFKDANENADQQNLIDLAATIIRHLKDPSGHHIGYEATVEPLKFFFGRSDCYAVEFKPIGRGDSETEAWAAFNHAAELAANSIGR